MLTKKYQSERVINAMWIAINIKVDGSSMLLACAKVKELILSDVSSNGVDLCDSLVPEGNVVPSSIRRARIFVSTNRQEAA